jgi:hypothetical protein
MHKTSLLVYRNASQKIEGSVAEVSGDEKPTKMEAKKESQDKDKKECHDKKGAKGKKSCLC